METTDKLPNNVRQIGQVGDNLKIYMEQRVSEYLADHRRAEIGELQIFYLLGREYHLGAQRVLVVRGALEEEMPVHQPIVITLDSLQQLERKKELYFPKLKLLGWMLNQPGYGVYGPQRQASLHRQQFGQCPLFMLSDSLEQTEEFYLWNGMDFEAAGGYLIYYDPNPAMANMTAKTESDTTGREDEFWRAPPAMEEPPEHKPKEEDPLEPWMQQRTAGTKREREAFREGYTVRTRPVSGAEARRGYRDYSNRRKAPEPEQEQEAARVKAAQDPSKSLSMLTSLSAVLLLVCVVMGMLLFNSIGTLNGIQTRLEDMNAQISQISDKVTDDEPIDVSTQPQP